MSRNMAPKQAGAAVEKQIAQLGDLRNAGTRATVFREWRQATLTLIERIWPDQATRAQRFRRIPFSVASASAEDRIQRDAFERGCAEARRLLQLWHSEIEAHGIRQEPEAPRLSEAVRAAFHELHPPVLPAQPASAPPKPRRRREKLSEMLGFTETAAPQMQAPVAPPPSQAPASGPTAGPTLAIVPPLPDAGPVPVAGGGVADAVAPAAPESMDTLATSIDHALEVAMNETLAAQSSRSTPAQAPAPAPAPVSPPPARTPKPMVSYVSRAFIAMADDLEELGVPAGHRDRVRLALLDLAHHLDAGSVTWHLMRDAVTLVMHYPALGRQAVPLLLPYLEAAA